MDGAARLTGRGATLADMTDRPPAAQPIPPRAAEPQQQLPALPRRPMLRPAVRRLWRDATTLQFGLDPERAVVLAGIGRCALDLLEALDGSRDLDGVVALAEARGATARECRHFLRLLAEAGALDDAAEPLVDRMGTPAALLPDLAASALRRASPGAANASWHRRRRARVRVLGGDRVGSAVAALLGAAGVGEVEVADPSPVQPADVGPCGLRGAAVGLPRGAVLGVHPPSGESGEGAPARRRRPPPPDLVVASGVDTLPAGALDPASPTSERTALLAVLVRDDAGIVGPMVLPPGPPAGGGQPAPCLRCLHLTRLDRDPGWGAVCAQLATPGTGVPADPPPCDVVLATATAAHAALQALEWLERGPADPLPATVGATLELRPPAWRLRRRAWQTHPLCGCARRNSA